MHLEKFVHSNTGKIIMSILLGIGLATFFRAVCKGKKCRLVASPPMVELEGKTYKFDNKCYTFEKNPITCTNNKKTVKIA